jgi:hypothetical protein
LKQSGFRFYHLDVNRKPKTASNSFSLRLHRRDACATRKMFICPQTGTGTPTGNRKLENKAAYGRQNSAGTARPRSCYLFSVFCEVKLIFDSKKKIVL